MTDYFALFDEPRRPWLDPDALKEKFLTRSAALHPDHSHGASPADQQAATARYTELNAAYQHLREPKDRLLHLLELELGRRPADIQTVPADSMDLLLQVGQRCRETDAFLAEHRKVSSPMLKAQVFERALEWTDQLQRLQQTISTQRDQLESRLKALNPIWESAPPGDATRTANLPLGELEGVYRLLSYLSRWSSQIQERIVQLSL